MIAYVTPIVLRVSSVLLSSTSLGKAALDNSTVCFLCVCAGRLVNVSVEIGPPTSLAIGAPSRTERGGQASPKLRSLASLIDGGSKIAFLVQSLRSAYQGSPAPSQHTARCKKNETIEPNAKNFNFDRMQLKLEGFWVDRSILKESGCSNHC